MLLKKTKAIALPLLIAAAASPVHADALQAPEVMLNGQKLTFPVGPAIIQDTAFVPLRQLFERQGAEVLWEETTRTVQAEKEDLTFTYTIGDKEAYLNNKRLSVPVPGRIVDGTTLVPLRLISEALGSRVAWNEQDRVITITSGAIGEATVEWGVNLRDRPNTESRVYRMLTKGETVQVLGEPDGFWLQVETKDGTIGYISALPKYTNYTSETYAASAADKLIAYGETFMGTPYEFGASPNQTDTFDCSSFVKHVFDEALGVELPRVSYNQAEVGKEVELEKLRKGDLLFFSARGLSIGHVAIYAGDGNILHTYSKESGVELRKFEGQWKDRFVTARRLL